MKKLLPLSVSILFATLFAASPNFGAAAEPVQESERFTMGGEIGVAYHEYQELSAGADSDFDSDGISWGLMQTTKLLSIFESGWIERPPA